MSTLAIYDSEGNRVDTDGTPEVSQRIANFFFGGVRVYLDRGREVELIVFFRARQSKSHRAEQYFAVYRTDTVRHLFSRFKADLEQRVEGDLGMLLQETSDDVALYTKLDTLEPPVPGTEREQQAISVLLSEGRSVRVGVGSEDEALGTLTKYVRGKASSAAIAEKVDIDELDDCDIAIEIGSYDGLEPLGQTKDDFDELWGRAKRKRRQSNASSQGDSTTRPTSSRPTPGDEDDTDEEGRSLVTLVGVVLVVILVLAILAGAGLWYLGYV